MAFTFGSSVTVDASAVFPKIVRLSGTLALAVYSKSGSLKARTITTAGPTVNAETNIDTVSSATFAVCALTATSALVVYDDGTDFLAMVLTISGTTVSTNSTTTLTHGNGVASHPGLDTIDSTNALYCYATAGSGKAVVLDISGTTVNENTIVEFEAATTAHNRPAVFSTTRAIHTWFDSSIPATRGVIINISGTTLTPQTSKTILSENMSTSVSNVPLATSRVSATQAIHSIAAALPTGQTQAVVLTLNGATFNIGATEAAGGAGNTSNARLSDTSVVLIFLAGATSYEGRFYNITGGDTLTLDSFDTIAVSSTLGYNWAANVDGTSVIVHGSDSSSITFLGSAPTASHLWLSTDGGATYTNIGDPSWGSDVVGGVVVVPGTAYQTIYAAVGSNLYKTTDQGGSWTLETAIGYEVDFLDLEKDNTTVIMANRVSGGNRASLWDGTTLTNIDTGKSTTGGATSGGDVV